MKTATCVLWSQFLLLGWIGVVQAAEPLFAGNAILEVELRGPLRKTIHDRRTPSERPFVIVVGGESWPVDVRTRGKSRVQYCRFPPLRLDFPAEETTSGPFAGQDKLKLVTHCGDGPQSADNLLEEYAAYRIFSMLSPVSHRVRLLRVSYVDTDKPGREPMVRHAFAIESIEHVAARNEAAPLVTEHLVESRIDPGQAALVFVFHYLIANVDWSLVKGRADTSCCHNTHLVRKDGMDFLIPYDFDLSGFVNPRYARRMPNVRKRSVRERDYAGYCLAGLPLATAIAAVAARRQDILELVDRLPWSDADDRAERLEFLEAFFAEAAAGTLAEHMAQSCIG